MQSLFNSELEDDSERRNRNYVEGSGRGILKILSQHLTESAEDRREVPRLVQLISEMMMIEVGTFKYEIGVIIT